MKPTLIYLLILAFTFLKGDDHSLSTQKQNDIGHNSVQLHNTLSGSNNTRSPADLFATAVCCDDDDDDDFEMVKKKTGSTVSFLLNVVFQEVFVHSELKRTSGLSKYSDASSQPAYIFQKELLI